MAAGLEQNELETLQLLPSSDYEYLIYGDCIEIEGTDDAEDFKTLRKSMQQLGFTPDTQFHIFQVLTAILKLGNCTFVPKPGDTDGACQFSPSKFDFKNNSTCPDTHLPLHAIR